MIDFTRRLRRHRARREIGLRGAIPIAAEALEGRTLLSSGWAGPEFQVNAYTPFIQTTVPGGDESVAADADGNFVVAWIRYDRSYNTGISARRFNSAGQPQGDEFRLGDEGRQNFSPSVAMDADGDFVIAWSSTAEGNTDIEAQRFDASGAARGGPFRVNATVESRRFAPSATMDDDGDFVVAWLAGEYPAIRTYARAYDRGGTPRGDEVEVDSPSFGSDDNPSVAMDADGDFVVAWNRSGYGSYGIREYDIMARRYDAAASPRGAEFPVTLSFQLQFDPSVAMDADGDFAVAWQSYIGTLVQRFTAAGERDGDSFSPTTDQSQFASVAMDPGGDFVVTWTSTVAGNTDVYARRYARGTAIGEPETMVNTFTAGQQAHSSVAMDDAGGFVVAYTSRQNDEGDVYARRYFGDDARVVGRYVFYNHSGFDGNDSLANPADDAAIALDKVALLAGEPASFSNVTSYDKGLNGVFIDVAGLPRHATLSPDDFLTRSGRGADRSTFTPGPSPLAVTVRRGAGVNGSDRVTLVFRDHNPADRSGLPQAVANGWLEVTMKAGADTRLAADDVFYFGNLVGEAGDNPTLFRVSAVDLAAVKAALNRTATPLDRRDLNRDGRINALDLATVKRNLNGALPSPVPAGTEGVLVVFVDLNRNGAFEAGERVGDAFDLGDIGQGVEKIPVRLANLGGGPLVLDGEFVLDGTRNGPSLSLEPRTGAPTNVVVRTELVDRTLDDGTVVQDAVIRFGTPGDPDTPKVLQPGEAIDLQIGGNVIGAAAGSGSVTRRGRRIRFTGTVVSRT